MICIGEWCSSPDPKNLGSKSPLNGPYFWNKSQNVAGKWCHISTTSFFRTLDLDPSVNYWVPKFGSWPVGPFDCKVSLVVGLNVNPSFCCVPFLLSQIPRTPNNKASWSMIIFFCADAKATVLQDKEVEKWQHWHPCGCMQGEWKPHQQFLGFLDTIILSIFLV